MSVLANTLSDCAASVLPIVMGDVLAARMIIEETSIDVCSARVCVVGMSVSVLSVVTVTSWPHLFTTRGLLSSSVSTTWYVLPAFAVVVYLCCTEMMETSGASFASQIFAISMKSPSRIDKEYPASVFWTVNLAGHWIVPSMCSPMATTSLLSAESITVSPSAMSVDAIRAPAASILYSH